MITRPNFNEVSHHELINYLISTQSIAYNSTPLWLTSIINSDLCSFLKSLDCMTVTVSSFKKQMVHFTKVADAKSKMILCKPAAGEIKHAYCCTLHTNCVVFFLHMFSILIIQRWHGRTSSTCTTVWSTIMAARHLGFHQVGPALIGPLLPVCAFIFVSSLKQFTSNNYPWCIYSKYRYPVKALV